MLTQSKQGTILVPRAKRNVGGTHSAPRTLLIPVMLCLDPCFVGPAQLAKTFSRVVGTVWNRTAQLEGTFTDSAVASPLQV